MMAAIEPDPKRRAKMLIMKVKLEQEAGRDAFLGGMVLRSW
jgi:hypothetical protein